MMHVSRRAAILFTIALSVPLTFSQTAFANGNGAVEIVKYLKPTKKGYLNQSQDREIKKKAFKASDVALPAPVANSELGFFAMVPGDKVADQAYCDQLLQNPRISGLSVVVPWSAIEPTEDNYDWHVIDNLLSLCDKNQKKTLILRVSTCGQDLSASADSKETISDTPHWVYEAGAKSISFTSPDGRQHTMPMFWDKNYLAKWSNFIREFASKYDQNPLIQSIGITGGGFSGGTALVPTYKAQTASASGATVDLMQALKKDYGLTQRQMVEHWKYVADLFPKRFTHARLNFNINGPVHGRMGEDALDEIADYLVYRYGERVFLTRAGIASGKHNFDDYRLLLKFHHDTLTGMQLADNVAVADLPKIAKNGLDDGISFAELPVSLATATDPSVVAALDTLRSHMGYQLVGQKIAVSDKVMVGQPLKASFAFVNVGAAPAMRADRNLDKDSPSSFRVQIELRDADGKPVLRNIHTPPTATQQWKPGQVVAWDEELKMIDSDKHQLSPGEYSVWMSLVDPFAQRKIHFANATSSGQPSSAEIVEVGKVTILPSGEATKTAATPSDNTGTQDKK